MREGLRAFLFASLFLLLPFNNCSSGDYASQPDPNVDSTVCDQTQVSCKIKSLTVNPGQNPIQINKSDADFPVGGTCNDGGFTSNSIVWQLYFNSTTTPVRTSYMAGASPSPIQCVNGTFSFDVNLLAITDDNVNRTGLYGGVYTLKVWIEGVDSQGNHYANSVDGWRIVNLESL